MAITTDDFNKIWASASPLTPYSFSESQYKEGWNFIGSTPPARQMWDFLQKNNDEKMQYLLNHFDNYLPLSGGGTLTGDVDITGDLSVSGAITGSIQYVNNGKVFAIGNTTTGNVDLGWSWANSEGAGLALRSTDYSSPGGFMLYARDANNTCCLTGKPDGSLTWDNKEVERVNASGSNYIRYESGIQIVFDRIGVSGASSYVKTYTYPVAFKSNSNVCITTGIRWASSNEQVSIQNDSNTKFEINITNASSNSHHMFFIAIGEWK